MGYAMKQREGGREGAEEERETKRKREREGGGESKRERHGMVVVESWLGYADWDGWVD